MKDVIQDSDLFEKAIFNAIDYATHVKSKSGYHHAIVNTADSISFEIRDGLFMIRVLKKKELETISGSASDDLPSDLKSKQVFQVTKVLNGCILVERGATQIAIPTERILYFQRGLAPFFR